MDEAQAFDVWSLSRPPPARGRDNETYKCDKINRGKLFWFISPSPPRPPKCTFIRNSWEDEETVSDAKINHFGAIILVNRGVKDHTCDNAKRWQGRCSFTWLTVAPTEPCSSICSILASGCSRCVAIASSLVFFCMSSMATSMGVRSNWMGNIQRCNKRPLHQSPTILQPLPHLPLLSGWRWSESSRRGRRAWWWWWSSSCTARWVLLVDVRSWWREWCTWSAAGWSSSQSLWGGLSFHSHRSRAPRRWSGCRPGSVMEQRYMQREKSYLFQIIISRSHVLNIVYLHQLMVTISEQYKQCTEYSAAQFQVLTYRLALRCGVMHITSIPC